MSSESAMWLLLCVAVAPAGYALLQAIRQRRATGSDVETKASTFGFDRKYVDAVFTFTRKLWEFHVEEMQNREAASVHVEPMYSGSIANLSEKGAEGTVSVQAIFDHDQAPPESLVLSVHFPPGTIVERWKEIRATEDAFRAELGRHYEIWASVVDSSERETLKLIITRA